MSAAQQSAAQRTRGPTARAARGESAPQHGCGMEAYKSPGGYWSRRHCRLESAGQRQAGGLCRYVWRSVCADTRARERCAGLTIVSSHEWSVIEHEVLHALHTAAARRPAARAKPNARGVRIYELTRTARLRPGRRRGFVCSCFREKCFSVTVI